jgi:hypothetical protein
MSGRLGNQLFQWAFAHQVAIKYASEIQPIYDSFHEHRGYESNLSSLKFPCTHVLHSKRRNSVGYLLAGLDKIDSKSATLGSYISSKLGIMRTRYHDEIPTLPAIAPNLVTGFFINWKVVQGIELLLAEEIKMALENVEVPFRIEGAFQVLHVRRGDFKSLKDTFGVLSSEYYARNLDRSLPTYICTDDEALVPDVQLATEAISVFGPSDLNPIQTLKLMSEASLVVMSNSTLSWWGGFLCMQNGGRAFLPKPYYKYLNGDATNFELPGFTIAPSIFEN